MRIFQTWAPLLTVAGLVAATPYPRDDLHDSRGMGFLMPRDCAYYCGSDNQFCCGSDQVCTTKQDLATCVNAGGGYPIYTTTWTETRTFTSTGYTYWDPVPDPTAGVDCVPKNDEQEACGPICCAGYQTCAFNGQCSAKPGYGEGTTVVITSDGKTTTQYSAPYRITGTTTVVTTGVITTATGTSAQPTKTGTEPIGAGGGGGGLSGGAIAGIVIGSIVGAILLLLIAFCCIAKGLWGVIFGGKKRNPREEMYEERYSRSNSRYSTSSARYQQGGWPGASSGAGVSEKKKKEGKKLLGLASLAGTMFALLNLRKEKKPVRKPGRPGRPGRSGPTSYYSGSYSYSGSSSRSGSSGLRSPRSAHTAGRSVRSGGSRGHRTHYSRSRRS